MRARAICEELDTLRLGGPPVLDVVLPELHELVGLETMVAYRVRAEERGWSVDLSHHSSPVGQEVLRLFKAFVAGHPGSFGMYDPVRPQPSQRNRVKVIATSQLTDLPQVQSCFYPVGVDQHWQLRVLVCEGPSLLAWVGGFLPERPDVLRNRLLAAMVPALRRRLSLERRLRDAPRTFAAFHVALEMLGAPAFVIATSGAIHEANSAARALLATSGSEVRAALRDAVAWRCNVLRFELTPLREPGAADYLAVLRPAAPETDDARIAHRVALAGARWQLTPRQREVLALLVTGASNGLIAQTLDIAERTVEFHVTALCNRVGADSRAKLTALVLSLD